MEMKDNNEDVLNIDIFTKLLNIAQDLSNFKS